MTVPIQPDTTTVFAENKPDREAGGATNVGGVNYQDREADGATNVGGVNYQVTPEYLAQARTDTLNTAQAVQDQLAQLKSYVTQLEDAWGGVARDTFLVLMQDYDVYSRMLYDALTDIASGLQGTYANYVNSEAENINNLRALGEDLPALPSGTNFD